MPNINYLYFRTEPWEGSKLVCVGYTVELVGFQLVASLSVHICTGPVDRKLGREIVAGKIAKGKTFEVVVLPKRIMASIILGAKYFLLSRER